jgi:hypothetical protein
MQGNGIKIPLPTAEVNSDAENNETEPTKQAGGIECGGGKRDT